MAGEKGRRGFIQKYNVQFFPTVSPGFDKTYDYREPNRPSIILRDPSTFHRFIKVIREKFLNAEVNVMFVCSFNEWFEQTQIEPTIGFGFEYLKTLANALNG